MKQFSALFSLSRFKKDPTKQYIKKFRIYPRFMLSHLDKWLKNMSLSGWNIVHCGVFFFWFEKEVPTEKEYFTYIEFTQKAKYSITLRHPFLERNYAVENKKSKINANSMKSLQIIEIDTKRIDTKNDVGYRELIADRDRLYLHYFIRNISVIAPIILLTVLLLILK